MQWVFRLILELMKGIVMVEVIVFLPNLQIMAVLVIHLIYLLLDSIIVLLGFVFDLFVLCYLFHF